MFSGKLLRKVIEGSVGNPGKGVGWLEKKLELPFFPTIGLHIAFPFHLKSDFPSFSISVELDVVAWNTRDLLFTGICKPHYLIDWENVEFADHDLRGYLTKQVKFAWDHMSMEGDLT
jgi:hypothetical protein